MDKSIKLARLYVKLFELEAALNNEILPLMSYVGCPDRELIESADAFRAKIARHLSEYEIKSTERKTIDGEQKQPLDDKRPEIVNSNR